MPVKKPAMLSFQLNVWHGLKSISKSSFNAYSNMIGQCKYLHTKVILSLLWLVETLLKTVCFLVLDFSLTLGLFFLHLVGDAAIGSEETPPRGFCANTVLIMNSLSHFFADFGFILEWSKGGLDHEHHHRDVSVDPYQVNVWYGLACITLIVPMVHMLLHKAAPSRIAHPINTLMPNHKEVDADQEALTNIANKLASSKANSRSNNSEIAGEDLTNPQANDEEHNQNEYQCDHWLEFVQGNKVSLWSIVKANQDEEHHCKTNIAHQHTIKTSLV